MPNYTPDQLALIAHISNDEVLRDIKETEREIASLRARITECKDGITMREEFIARLRGILASRAEIPDEE